MKLRENFAPKAEAQVAPQVNAHVNFSDLQTSKRFERLQLRFKL